MEQSPTSSQALQSFIRRTDQCMADPSILKEAVEACKWLVPGGLPQVVDSSKRGGRRLRTWMAPKSRVPICLAIQPENPDDAGLVSSLAFSMSQYIATHQLGSTVQVQTVSSDDLDNAIALLTMARQECERLRFPELAAMPGDFQRLHRQRRARMYLFGRLVRRTSSGKKLYELELQGILEHRVFRVAWKRPSLVHMGVQRTRVNSAFSNVLVNVIRIPMADEDPSLHDLGSTLVQAVQILIGVCSQVQDDPIAAMDLLDRLLDQLAVDSGVGQDIRKQLLKTLVARCSLASLDALIRKDRREVRRISEIITRRCPSDHDALVTLAYATYLLEPLRPSQALEYAQQAADCASRSGNGASQYNLAFLLAQNGRFEESLQEYDRIAATSYEGEEGVVASVLLFFLRELWRYPCPVHVFFILGFLEWKKLSPSAHSVRIWRKNDVACHRYDVAYCIQAIRMFKLFRFLVLVTRSSELAPWAGRADIYIRRIHRHLENGGARAESGCET